MSYSALSAESNFTSKTMSVLFLLIGISLLMAIGFLGAFIWSVNKGQYEDEYTPSVRILLEDQNNQDENKTVT